MRNVASIVVFCGLSACHGARGGGGLRGGSDGGPLSQTDANTDGRVPVSPTEGCEGHAVTTDGVLDLDVRSVLIDGLVTVNGDDPSHDYDSGVIEFVQTERPFSTAAVEFYGPESDSYAIRLTPGEYNVFWQGLSENCDDVESLPNLPCGRSLIRSGQVIAANGTLDLDVRSIVVSGEVTQDGARMPDAADSRGSLSFSSNNGDSVETSLYQSRGAMEFATVVGPADYAVIYSANTELCLYEDNQVPCLGGLLRPSVALTTSGTLDLDIATARVTTYVTVDGERMPRERQQPGGITLTASSGQAASVAYESGAEATGTFVVMRGAYQVTHFANRDLCQAGQPLPTVPCIGQVLDESLSVVADGNVDFDVRPFSVTGHVTINEGALPSGEEVQITFASAIDATTVSTNDGSYAVRLLPGTYTVSMAANYYSICDAGAPCGGGTFVRGVALSNDGTLDLNLNVITLTGAVSVNGNEVEFGAYSNLFFTSTDPTETHHALAGINDGHYETRLVPGVYNVTLSAYGCDGDSPFPCTSSRILRDVRLTNDGVLDIDVPMVRLAGTVMHNEVSIDEGSGLHLLFTDKDGGSAEASLSISRQATYQINLVPGHYVIASVVDGETFALTNEVLLGCDE